MTSSGSLVVNVVRPSPASSAGIRKGDHILKCNGFPVTDWVDILSASSGRKLLVELKRGLSTKNVLIQRRPGVNWGITLADSQARVCSNRCVFCFVDQQPPGLRTSLLLKDDDVRFSFLEGTYITLTDKQAKEAVARGFNTLHVSVQTTDPVLRGKLLGHPGPMPILPNLDLLASRGVDVQAQVVEVPDWNSGTELERTISDLYERSNVRILGIVPVGLTRWRKNLVPLHRPDRNEALKTLAIIEKWQKKAIQEKGTPWIFASDEYYLITGKKFPPSEHYADCTLQANGIGLIAQDIEKCRAHVFKGEGTVVTGTLAAGTVKKLLRDSLYHVVPVENRLMGSSVGVTGLISATDAIHSVKVRSFNTGNLYLPSSMFNHNGVSLDEYTAVEIGRELGMCPHVHDSLWELP